RRRALVLADQRGSQELARIARGRISAAHQSPSRDGGRAVGQVHAVDGGRGVISGLEERAFDPAFVSSAGAARQGSRDGGVLGLRTLGHAQTYVETQAKLDPKALGE